MLGYDEMHGAISFVSASVPRAACVSNASRLRQNPAILETGVDAVIAAFTTTAIECCGNNLLQLCSYIPLTLHHSGS